MNDIKGLGGEGSIDPTEKSSRSSQTKRRRPGELVDLGDAVDVNLSAPPEVFAEDRVDLSPEALAELERLEKEKFKDG